MYYDYVHMQVLHCFLILVILNSLFPHRTPVATLLKKLTQSSPGATGSFKLLKEEWSLTGTFCELSIVKKIQGPNLLWISIAAVYSLLQHQCHIWLVAFHETLPHLLALKFFQISLLLCSLCLRVLMQISHLMLSTSQAHILRTMTR